ncbi:MAG TPA: type III-A CRISPR-associated protein Cas10/Csm1 [Candidatus Desulfofervidus auxilii]|uniref:CRISPR system single-strand-specific deoxyribonuclease Cas10/Csm1 (subtype III-A) n=2 Tax=Thermodesulfobacteriota TaxID=200940 RepID=A0A7C0Y6I2_DESA2|nr:CRISPR/Cas system-associated protein Cas10 [Candidatus Thermodesulfobacterium syntrophicum]RLG10099.1 MAG: type III-A CRISPR-associated protein Cas10/Csm1 [Candidatus Pacearchaeota archaeon]HDD43810.1 type III-A CRISPR-associated protein Cas10/Csm1 [Candidatus Desulfofervidus auxilii]
MEDKILYKIILASLLHDIGKVYERADIALDDTFISQNQELYQPFQQGYYSHKHVLYTVHFIEKFNDYLPDIFQKSREDLNFLINLAGKHHKPESPEEIIIHVADCLSSGFERRGYEKEIKAEKSAKEVPLMVIFEDISLTHNWKEALPESLKYYYNLGPLSPEAIFPINSEEKKIKVGRNVYRDLVSSFEESFKNLLHKESPLLWLNHLNSLLMHYLSFVPSATVERGEKTKFKKILSDVSLYDHLYFTSTIASALYIYHKETKTLDKISIEDHNREKFLFIEGNFYGIQNFIFATGGETNKNAAKLLRGRSFMVSILSELACELILEKLKLTRFSVLFNTAGKFLILAPNLDGYIDKLREAEDEINKWLYEHFYGETSIGIIYTTSKPIEFLENTGYENLLKRLGRQSEEKKYQKFDLYKFGGYPEDYFVKFSGASPCKLCGKRPATKKLKDFEVCEICLDQVNLGEKLVKRDLLVVYNKNEPNTLSKVLYFDRYRISLSLIEDVVFKKIPIKNVIVIWDISLPINKTVNINRDNSRFFLARKFINAYVPRDEDSKPLTFEELSNKAIKKKEDKAYGIKALGILKMDVDNLGTIFAKGIRPEKRTFSRYLVLSRYLDLFFSYYLPYLCAQKYPSVYNVFTGGDDLFMVGPWNVILEFAEEVSKKFREYTCKNPAFTISAGYLLTKPILPIQEMTECVENSLKRTKERGKNGITVFGVYVNWREFYELKEIKKQMKDWYEKEILNRAHLYKLNYILNMVETSQKLMEEQENLMKKQGENAFFDKIYKNLKTFTWPSKLYYFTVRNIAKTGFKNREERIKKVEDILVTLKKALDKHGGGFRIPLWQIIYETRRASHEEN